MSRKLTDEEITDILFRHNLIKIGNEEYKNNTTKILCINADGYKVMPTIQHLKSNKIPRSFDKNNPYTIENIKLYLNRNNPNIEILSKQYISSDSKLHCKCKIDNFEWNINWDNLKQGQGCPKCKSRKLSELNLNTLDDIQQRLKVVNNDLIIMDDVYIDSKTKLTIKCNKNHIFKRNWCDLLRNSNCPECAKINYPGGYNIANAEFNKQTWINKKAIVYVVKIFDVTESFYKIGVTNRSVDERLKYQIPYCYEILYEINTDMYNAVYLEDKLQNAHSDFQYIPLKNFYGWTECYSCINTNIIEEYIKYDKQIVDSTIQND